MKFIYQIVYWRDIPAQVRVRFGRERKTHPLSSRFQEAIDEAAMLARATSEDAYLEDWRTSQWLEAETGSDWSTETLVSQLENDYPPERLEALKANKGYERAGC